MKYLVPCFLVLPLIASCVPDDPYYNPGPGVEVYPGRPNQHYHHNHGYYRPAPPRGNYHEHQVPVQHAPVISQPAPRPSVNPQANVHGHNEAPPAAVVVPSNTVPRNEEVKQIRPPEEDPSKVHGHD